MQFNLGLEAVTKGALISESEILKAKVMSIKNDLRNITLDVMLIKTIGQETLTVSKQTLGETKNTNNLIKDIKNNIGQLIQRQQELRNDIRSWLNNLGSDVRNYFDKINLDLQGLQGFMAYTRNQFNAWTSRWNNSILPAINRLLQWTTPSFLANFLEGLLNPIKDKVTVLETGLNANTQIENNLGVNLFNCPNLNPDPPTLPPEPPTG